MTTVRTDLRRGVNGGIAVKVACRAVSTSNITLSGLQTIDTIVLAADDRVLAAGQTTGSENGIYVVSSGTWTRALDWNGSGDIAQGTLVRINQGSNAGRLYAVSTSDPITIGTTAVAFSVDNFVTGIPLVDQGSETVFLASWAGKCVRITTGITVNTAIHAANDVISAQNTTAGDLTITQGSGFTLRLAGLGTTGNRTVTQKAEFSLHFVSATEAYIFGAGVL